MSSNNVLWVLPRQDRPIARHQTVIKYAPAPVGRTRSREPLSRKGPLRSAARPALVGPAAAVPDLQPGAVGEADAGRVEAPAGRRVDDPAGAGLRFVVPVRASTPAPAQVLRLQTRRDLPVDDTYRRLMNRQLTVQESRHRMARAICHGRSGPDPPGVPGGPGGPAHRPRSGPQRRRPVEHLLPRRRRRPAPRRGPRHQGRGRRPHLPAQGPAHQLPGPLPVQHPGRRTRSGPAYLPGPGGCRGRRGSTAAHPARRPLGASRGGRAPDAPGARRGAPSWAQHWLDDLAEP